MNIMCGEGAKQSHEIPYATLQNLLLPGQDALPRRAAPGTSSQKASGTWLPLETSSPYEGVRVGF